jgi:hypothetical protein
MDLNEIFIIINGLFTIIIGCFGYFFWDKIKKQKEIGLSLSIKQLENRLTKFYYPIYFRLIRLNYSKYQLNYMKKIFNKYDIINIEEDIVLNIHKELINIIAENHYLLDNNDKINGYILKYINHALLYINLRKFKILKKPSDYGFGFPNEFFDYIKEKTDDLRYDYDKILGNKNNQIKKILTNNYDYHIINIMNDPCSDFNKNYDDDINNFYESKTSDIFNKSSLNIDNIPNLDIIFKKVNLSNISNIDN